QAIAAQVGKPRRQPELDRHAAGRRGLRHHLGEERADRQDLEARPGRLHRAQVGGPLVVERGELALELAELVAEGGGVAAVRGVLAGDRKSTRLNSSHVKIPYALLCLK